MQCAMWIPEARFKDDTKMEPIELKSIPAQRQKLVCYLCKMKTGACIQVSVLVDFLFSMLLFRLLCAFCVHFLSVLAQNVCNQ